MTRCNRYSEEFISRFVDQEVTPFDHSTFIRHMNDCQDCAELESKFRLMTSGFERHVDSQTLRIKKESPPISFEKQLAWKNRYRNLTLKLASLGTAALIFTVALLPWAGDPARDRIHEPSAIVNSVDTYGSSVMIIETVNTQHTIIWFSET